MKIDFSKPPRNLNEIVAYQEEARRQEIVYKIERKRKLFAEIEETLECIDVQWSSDTFDKVKAIQEKIQELKNLD